MPLGALLSVVLLAWNVPLQARWGLSQGAVKSSVQDFVAAHASGKEWTRLELRGKFGLFDVDEAFVVPGGTLFYDSAGAFSAAAASRTSRRDQAIRLRRHLKTPSSKNLVTPGTAGV